MSSSGWFDSGGWVRWLVELADWIQFNRIQFTIGCLLGCVASLGKRASWFEIEIIIGIDLLDQERASESIGQLMDER